MILEKKICYSKLTTEEKLHFSIWIKIVGYTSFAVDIVRSSILRPPNRLHLCIRHNVRFRKIFLFIKKELEKNTEYKCYLNQMYVTSSNFFKKIEHCVWTSDSKLFSNRKISIFLTDLVHTSGTTLIPVEQIKMYWSTIFLWWIRCGSLLAH